MKLIFLDIDGVLNNHRLNKKSGSNTLSRRCVREFNRIIEATGAKIVLSSAWRYIVLGGAMTPTGFEYMLRTHGVIANVTVFGITKEDEVCSACMRRKTHDEACPSCALLTTRGHQIQEFLDRTFPHPTAYLVLDDLELGIAASGHPFIQTDGDRGLTREQADKAIEILSKSLAPTAAT